MASETLVEDKNFEIPTGDYCYDILGIEREDGEIKINIRPCLYWHRMPDRNSQENGYCSFLDTGDWEGEGHGLLWDMVKECNVNTGDDYAEEERE